MKMDTRETNVIVAKNSFIKAKYDGRMSVNAMKLLRLTIAQCRLADDDFYNYEVSISELAELFGIASTNLYSDIKSIVLQMMKTIIYIGDDNSKNFKAYTMFSECEYIDKSGIVKIRISSSMKPFFLELKKNFTQVPLGAVVTMKSKYSIRIYELILEKLKNKRVYADKHYEIYLSVEEIRSITSTENKLKQMVHFKTKLLNVAIAEIEEVCMWKIVVNDYKPCRSIKGFNLDIWSAVGYERSLKSNG